MDSSLYRAVNRLADGTPFAHPFFVAYARYGIVLFAGLVVAGWWSARRAADRQAMAAVLWGLAGTCGALGVSHVVGDLVGRARPFAAMAGVHPLIAHRADFSFPSDHATAVAAIAAGLWLADRRLGGLAAGLALLMAFARVYVGVHYPGDVAAGLLLGTVVIFGLWPVVLRLLPAGVRDPGATRRSSADHQGRGRPAPGALRGLRESR
jgi:undecaprenyl-diphosphatase